MATNGVVKEVPLKQRAAQYNPKDNSVHIREIPVPSIKPDELLVEVSSASLCHSDLMLFEPNEQGLILTDKPVTMGHEAVGKVLQVGKESKGFKEGDVVS
jgi:alcohol dehydrogenase, propanol-preferring